MRNICVVTEDIYKIAAHDNNAFSYDKEDLLLELNKMKLDMCYAAPEYLNSSHFFIILGRILSKYINKEDCENIEWCKQIIKIFKDPNYKI
jgi:hypothetical protein